MELCVIEDHPVNLAVLKGVLSKVAGWKVEGYQNPRTALDRCREKTFDLVIADYQMPGLNGIEVIAQLRQYPDYTHIPVVMVTADNDRAVRIAAIRAGATDFLTKPVDPEELRVRAGNLLELRQAQKALADRATHLADEVAAATRAIAAREEEIITRLARAIEYRDGGTGDHVLRVARVSRLLAGALGMPLPFCRNLYLAAQLHDTGKIGLPDAILMKTGRLTEDEITVMRRHTEMGGEVLRDGSSDLIRMAHDVALGHHERWDGTGYPRGIAGEAIPLAARIVAVADVLDALRSARPYKLAWPLDRALDEIRRLSGAAFDPAVVAALVDLWPDITPLYAARSATTERASA